MRFKGVAIAFLGANVGVAVTVNPEGIHRRELPEGAIIAGYATNCDENVTRAVEQGVNVIYW